MIRLLVLFLGLTALTACSNSPDLTKGEIEIISLIRDAAQAQTTQENFVDARKLVTRDKIDASGMEVLFVELESGKNGTSIKYPGTNIGEVWLGVDGTTITFKNGHLIATRGLGEDLMSSEGTFPSFHVISDSAKYLKMQSWLLDDNQIKSVNYSCTAAVESARKAITIFEKTFLVQRVLETCKADDSTIKNEYFFERNGIVRRSRQYHSPALGHIFFERLE
jgi:hypothetical protein